MVERVKDAKIEAEVLSVCFDAGHWLVVDHGAKTVLSVEDLGGEPRAGRVSYRNTWGLTRTVGVQLRNIRRLDLT